jgi:phage-related protein
MTDSQNQRKPLVWLSGEVKTPPFSPSARIEAGILLRRLQEGEILSLPVSRPMPSRVHLKFAKKNEMLPPSIASHCHELRIDDSEANKKWRIIYRIDSDAIIIADVFQKTTQKMPTRVIENCQTRLRWYAQISEE